MNKGISGSDSYLINCDKQEITATNNETVGKRGLDINVINEVPIEFVPSVSPGSSIRERGEALSVVKDIETDIINYVVPVGSRFIFNRASCTGDNRAIFRLYINGVATEDKNTWWSDFNAEFEMGNTEVGPGITVRMTVEHCSNKGNGDFSTTLKGSLFNV